VLLGSQSKSSGAKQDAVKTIEKELMRNKKMRRSQLNSSRTAVARMQMKRVAGDLTITDLAAAAARMSYICFVLLLAALLLLGCGTDSEGAVVESAAPAVVDDVRPVEEEQIENVVSDYFSRDSAAPDYTVTIQAVEDGWARASLSPVGVENSEPNLVYLQDQSATAIEAPTADPEANPGNIAPVETTSGWTIIIGPQVQFSTEELDAAGVPPFIRE